MSFIAARERAGLSQPDVARILGVDQSAVSHWETGRTKPRVGTLMRLAALYRCTVDELLNGNKEGFKNG